MCGQLYLIRCVYPAYRTENIGRIWIEAHAQNFMTMMHANLFGVCFNMILQLACRQNCATARDTAWPAVLSLTWGAFDQRLQDSIRAVSMFFVHGVRKCMDL